MRSDIDSTGVLPLGQPGREDVAGRVVAEVLGVLVTAIEEIPVEPLTVEERQELESLRETVDIMSDPDAVADLAQAMAETREAAAQDRERQAQPGADWSTYAECPVCRKPTGESCIVGNLTLHRWPHRARPLLTPAEATVGDGEQTDWSAYHACGECGQQTGKPCMSAQGGVARINPHQYRERLPAA